MRTLRAHGPLASAATAGVADARRQVDASLPTVDTTQRSVVDVTHLHNMPASETRGMNQGRKQTASKAIGENDAMLKKRYY